MQLKLGLALGIECVNVLLVLFVEEHILEADEFGVSADELVACVVLGGVLHDVFRVVDEEALLLLVIRPAELLGHYSMID